MMRFVSRSFNGPKIRRHIFLILVLCFDMISESKENKALECMVSLLQFGKDNLYSESCEWMFGYFDGLEGLQSMLWSYKDDDRFFEECLQAFCSRLGCVEASRDYGSAGDSDGYAFMKVDAHQRYLTYRSLHYLFIKGRMLAFGDCDRGGLEALFDSLLGLHLHLLQDRGKDFETALRTASEVFNMPIVTNAYFNQSIRFPVLLLGVNGGLSFCPDRQTLMTTNTRALRSGMLLQNRIIDCNGHAFLPRSVVKIRRLGFSIFFNPLIEIRYVFEFPPRAVVLQDLIQEVALHVSAEEDFYSENVDVKVLLSRIQKVGSFEELIRLFDGAMDYE
jgi:hypothetical protein